MTRVLSRLPDAVQPVAAKALSVIAVLCTVAAFLCFLAYGETTETSGALWWKETREIPQSERRPYQVAGVGLVVAAVCCLAGALELFLAQARRTEVALGIRGTPDSAVFVLARLFTGRKHRAEVRYGAWRQAFDAQQAEAARAAAQRQYEESTAGRAQIAFKRGDPYFSIEFEVDGDLATHLNDIHHAGWREHSLSTRHRTTGISERRYGGHETTRESVAIRTYVFRRRTS